MTDDDRDGSDAPEPAGDPEADAWFSGLDPEDEAALVDRIRDGGATAPADWPGRAVAAGFAADTDAYYARLHAATTAATEAAVRDRERADDQQLIHAVRARDDAERTANELAERAAEWAGSLFADVGTDLPAVRALAARSPDGALEERVVSLAARVDGLATEADRLEGFVRARAPGVVPNLAALAGPVLAARLLALAGGLEQLAKMPSGTVQVLGAEDALFAHLRGGAPSPKHGVIYIHPYVRNTRPADRGSAARAVAGKLTIAARIDHYSGDRRPSLEEELDARIRTIRARADDGGEG